ncbi:cache domain-containing sensor histidine kinase [Paenibacillus ferrarius]|uniref:cache domain-containing sensor histidine kinase n=1 Tax=Paenibacillus ferrarius TaxID=1469647 RepID=UPI003D2D6B7E
MLKKIRESLKWKLVLLISSLIFVIIGVIGTFSYHETSRTIRADVERFANQIIEQSNLNLNRYYLDNERFFYTIAGSREFREWSLIGRDDRYDQYDVYRQIEDQYIEPYITYHPEILSVKLYNQNGNERIYRTGRIDYNLILNSGYSLAQEHGLLDMNVSKGKQMLVSLNGNYTNGTGKPVVTPVLTFIQRFQFSFETVYLAMDVSLIPMQEMLQGISLGKEGESYILDEHGTIVANKNTSLINTKLDSDFLSQIKKSREGAVFISDTQRLVVYQTFQNTEWKVLVTIPYREVAKSIFIVRNVTLWTAIGSWVISLILVIIISDSVTKRLKDMRRTIKSTRAGELNVLMDVAGTDEVSELARAYNHLLNRLESNVQQLTESRVMQQEAVLSALQSQINSHFLYNALESINSLANLTGNEEIMQTTIALSAMLRYTSNYQNTIVTLEEEIAHLTNFLNIIGILYEDEIQSHIELPDDLKRVLCLKAIIQPIVENSIKHGFESTGQPMRIHISCSRYGKSYIKICITDDGIGFTDTKLAAIQNMLKADAEQNYKQGSKIGLRNVHNRLRMRYPQPETGVSVGRQSNGLTEVSIIFPLQMKEA